ncbi:MAG: hypothetical protein Q8M83_04760 [bacterium]|nr:hypothetical protein [bacterium]
MKQYVFVLFLIAAFLAGAPALAQTDDGTAGAVADDATQTNAAATTNTTATPSGFGLFWQGIKERVALTLTFNPVKKAEKAVRYAEKRMEWAQAIAEKAKDNPKLQEKAQAVMERANVLLNKVEENKEALLQRKEESAKKILEKTADQMLRRQAVLDVLEAKLDPERLQAIDKMREDNQERTQRLLNAVSNENISQEVRDHLQEVKDRVDERVEEVRVFREEKKDLLEKALEGDATAKQELKNLNQQRLETLKENKEEVKDLKKEIKDVGKDIIQGVRQERVELREKVKEGDEGAKEELKNLNQTQKQNVLERREDRAELKDILKNNVKELRQELKKDLLQNRTQKQEGSNK